MFVCVSLHQLASSIVWENGLFASVCSSVYLLSLTGRGGRCTQISEILCHRYMLSCCTSIFDIIIMWSSNKKHSIDIQAVLSNILYLQLIWKIFCYQLLQCLVCHTCQTCRQGLQELRQFFPCSGVMVLPFDLLKNSFPKGCYGCLINQKELSLYLADKQIIANVTNHLTKS